MTLPDHLLIQPILKYNTDCEVFILGFLVDNIIKVFHLPSRLLNFSQARYYLANKNKHIHCQGSECKTHLNPIRVLYLHNPPPPPNYIQYKHKDEELYYA